MYYDITWQTLSSVFFFFGIVLNQKDKLMNTGHSWDDLECFIGFQFIFITKGYEMKMVKQKLSFCKKRNKNYKI